MPCPDCFARSPGERVVRTAALLSHQAILPDGLGQGVVITEIGTLPEQGFRSLFKITQAQRRLIGGETGCRLPEMVRSLPVTQARPGDFPRSSWIMASEMTVSAPPGLGGLDCCKARPISSTSRYARQIAGIELPLDRPWPPRSRPPVPAARRPAWSAACADA